MVADSGGPEKGESGECSGKIDARGPGGGCGPNHCGRVPDRAGGVCGFTWLALSLQLGSSHPYPLACQRRFQSVSLGQGEAGLGKVSPWNAGASGLQETLASLSL